MAVNPDPKPGRWILPLVILGMIAFTYFFVRQLPEASPDTTLLGAPETTSTTSDGTTETTLPGGTAVDPDTQAYLAELDAINSQLQLLSTEIVTVNDEFDADPREVEFPEAEDRFEAVATSTQTLAEQLSALTVPAGLEQNQEAMQRNMDLAAGAANDALAGLRSTDSGELRRAAVEAYTIHAQDFATEVTNTKNAAGVSA
ncbi:MAG: hypothetical protein ACRDVL_01320 [Acidimicrobiia bacterium]